MVAHSFNQMYIHLLLPHAHNIAECAPVERSRRSALFKVGGSSSKYRELNDRLIQLEEKVRQ